MFNEENPKRLAQIALVALLIIGCVAVLLPMIGQRTIEDLRRAAAAVQALVSALAAELPGDARLSAPSQRQGPGRREGAALPYRRYEGAGGRPILVGRDAAANDELTLHVAGPRDLWLHARGWAGAHVIVPRNRGQETPAEVFDRLFLPAMAGPWAVRLVDAAGLTPGSRVLDVACGIGGGDDPQGAVARPDQRAERT